MKNYSSLTDLKRDIEKRKGENVLDFNGWELITNKNRYTLYDSQVYVTHREDIKNVKKSQKSSKKKV